VFQEVNNLLGHLAAVHDEGVSVGHHQEVSHPLQLGALDRNLSVVLSRHQPGGQWIEALTAGDDSHFKVGRAQSAGKV